MTDPILADAVVVGGGLAGLAAAFAVADSGLSTIHLAPKGPPDRRTSALMMPSVRYMQQAELIGDPADIGNRLGQIRIIDATNRFLRAPESVFRASELGLEAFGWNFSNARLAERFAAHKSAPNLQTIEAPLQALRRGEDGVHLTLSDGRELVAKLVVGADGKKSLVREAGDFRTRENGFTQAALVCDLILGRPLGDMSVEFHYANGPFTLVPAGGSRANLVWIDDRGVLKAAQHGGAEELVTLFLSKSQRLFGTIELASPVHIFLLSTLSVATPGEDGIVLVGEAAHAFPPIGAQGLNLSLRDVADLASTLTAVNLSDADWAGQVSRDYAGRRAADLTLTGTVVDVLFRSLLADMLPAQALRSAGMWALKLSPQLRVQAFRMGMGVR